MLAEALYTGRKQGLQEGNRVTANRANQNMKVANQNIKAANDRIRELQSEKDLDEFLMYGLGTGLVVDGILDQRREEETNA